jgi:hypothetical protein
MAKEFKDYNTKYAKLKNTFLGYELVKNDRAYFVDLAKYTFKWRYMDALVKAAHTEIAYAVYKSDGAEEWQMFRVSLQGMSTSMKLARLEYRWRLYVVHGEDATVEALERCRINNYVDSMKRSGLINLAGEILK